MASDEEILALIREHAVPALFPGDAAASVEIEQKPGPTGGFSGEMRRYVLHRPSGGSGPESVSIVVKHFPEARLPASKMLGLAREGVFYDWITAADKAPPQVSKMVSKLIAKVFYAKGDMSTGSKLVIMEDLAAEGVGLSASNLYGHKSPVNWGKGSKVDDDIVKAYTAEFADAAANGAEKELAEQQKAIERVCSLKVAECGAHWHALHWREPGPLGETTTNSSSQLPEAAFLNGPWFKNATTAVPASEADIGKQQWTGTLNFAINSWRRFLDEILPKSDVKLDPRIVAFVDQAIADTTWENYIEDMRNRSWTLIHGDFHPGNMLWRTLVKEGEGQQHVALVDWEAVGFGNGPQEIAQALISHATPATRRLYEKEVLDAYFNVILKEAPNGIDVEARRKAFEDEYKCCGMGRWLWMLGVCATATPPPMVQYFHDQMLAFGLDHGLFEKREKLPILFRP